MKKIIALFLLLGLCAAPVFAAESTSNQPPETVKLEKTDLSKAKEEPAKDKASAAKVHKGNKKHHGFKKVENKQEEKKH